MKKKQQMMSDVIGISHRSGTVVIGSSRWMESEAGQSSCWPTMITW